MAISEIMLGVLKNNGFDGEDSAAQVHFDALDDGIKIEYRQEANNINLATMITSGLSDVFAKSVKGLHTRLDSAIPPSPGVVPPESKPGDKPPKKGDPPKPPAKTQREIELEKTLKDLEGRQTQQDRRQVRIDIREALGALSFVNDTARDMFMESMTSKAELNEEGETVIRMIGAGENGADELRTPVSAVQALRGNKDMAAFFAKDAVPGTGGGGGGGKGSEDSEKMPGDMTYEKLLADPEEMAKWQEKDPEGYTKLLDKYMPADQMSVIAGTSPITSDRSALITQMRARAVGTGRPQ